MKLNLARFLLIAFIPTNALAHSGGTDGNGCHAGSQPYHCHNGSSNSGSSNSGDNNLTISVGAWDLNLGYQYQIEQTELIPFVGFSVGKSDKLKDTMFGANLGLKLKDGWYTGYVSTSKSLQFGYSFFHLSINSEYLGLGIRFSYDDANSNQSSIYTSGSILFKGDEHTH